MLDSSGEDDSRYKTTNFGPFGTGVKKSRLKSIEIAKKEDIRKFSKRAEVAA